LGIVGLHHNYIGDRYNLLVRGTKRAGLLRLCPQSLDRVHQFLGLIQKRLTQFRRPVQVGVHFGDQGWELGDCFDVLIPGLVVHFGNVIGVLHKSCRLHDLQRIHRRRQDDADQRVGMKRDGHRELFQFIGAKLWGR
jgi:hypothetical protein